MNLLEVKNICKTYGSGETAVKALRNVSLPDETAFTSRCAADC